MIGAIYIPTQGRPVGCTGTKGSGTPIERTVHVPKAWVQLHCMIMSLANAGPLLGHKPPSTTHTCICGMSSASAEVHSMGSLNPIGYISSSLTRLSPGAFTCNRNNCTG